MTRNTLLWIVLLIMCVTSNSGVNCKMIKLGLITPPANGGIVAYDRVAAAATMGMEAARAAGYLAGVDVKFIWRNGNCNGKAALGVVVDLKDDEDVDGFIGIPCSVAAINAGKIISYWNLPHFSFSSADPDLADKVTYDTLIRLISPFNRLADAMTELFIYYKWNRVLIVTGPDEYGNCEHSGRALEHSMDEVNITLAEAINWDLPYPSERKLLDALRRIKMSARIVVVCANAEVVRQFMMLAQAEGMTDGEYVFIIPSLLPAENWEKLWLGDDGRDEEARRAYQPVLQMALGFTTGHEAEEFMELFPYKMTEDPWYYNGTLEMGYKGSSFSLFLFDSVYMYAMAADEAYRRGDTPRNGSLMFQIALHTSFVGKTGLVRLDSNGDRVGDYLIWQLAENAGSYSAMMDVLMTSPPGERINVIEQRYWGSKYGTRPPPDTPPCGFTEQLCPEDNTSRDIAIISCIVAMVLVACIAAVSILLYRRKKFESDLELMLWKVKYEDIEFTQLKVGQSRSSVEPGSGSKNSFSTMSSNAIGPGAGDPNATVKVGYYKGGVVTVHLLEKTGVLLTRQDHLELKQMRELTQDNLNPFIGVCIDPPNLCILTKYCSRGSLQDIIANDDIKLDINFKKSLIVDMIHGMEYLHRSHLKSHGRLKSSNCVVDGRWVLKVTDFGLTGLREAHYEHEDMKFKDWFWKAPELLREYCPPVNGTQKGDVYSFAIILQELLYRCPPFEVMGEMSMVPKDIVGRVRNGETPPFRPELPATSPDIDGRLLNLMKECWLEDCSARPDFTSVRSKFNAITKGERFNIMDNMLAMMEKYASNLEDVINERTKQLMEEKKKTDILLYRMLPRIVADCLKTGKLVEPELYPEVTVYFSDIVSFTEMSSQSTPLQVIDFLNDLWTLFDGVIEKCDVYKVETIGDAYMVASGLPERNGNQHVKQIANMSLEILSSVMCFKIRHQPGKQLKVRIGMHTGPVVAGVVGQTMPRYCLFGDTVNTASRMESTGEALRIHMSGQAVEALRRCDKTYVVEKRGDIEIKGKGVQTTYWLQGREGYSRPLPLFSD